MIFSFLPSIGYPRQWIVFGNTIPYTPTWSHSLAILKIVIMSKTDLSTCTCRLLKLITSTRFCQISPLYGKQPIYSEASGQHEPPQQISSSEIWVILVISQMHLLLYLSHCQDKRVLNILGADHHRPWLGCDHRWRCTHSTSSNHSRHHWWEYLCKVDFQSTLLEIKNLLQHESCNTSLTSKLSRKTSIVSLNLSSWVQFI